MRESVKTHPLLTLPGTSPSKLDQDGNDIVHMEDRRWELGELSGGILDGTDGRRGMGDGGWKMGDGSRRMGDEYIGGGTGDGGRGMEDERWKMGDGITAFTRSHVFRLIGV